MFERIRTVDDGDETIDLFAIDGTQESSASAEIYLHKVCLHLSCRQHLIQISIFYHYIII